MKNLEKVVLFLKKDSSTVINNKYIIHSNVIVCNVNQETTSGKENLFNTW